MPFLLPRRYFMLRCAMLMPCCCQDTCLITLRQRGASPEPCRYMPRHAFTLAGPAPMPRARHDTLLRYATRAYSDDAAMLLRIYAMRADMPLTCFDAATCCLMLLYLLLCR